MQTPQDNPCAPICADLARRVVLIGPSVRAAAQSLQIAGYSPIGIDQFGDLDTQQACSQWHRLQDFRDPPHSTPDSTRIEPILCQTDGVWIVGGLASGYDWLEPIADRILGASPTAFRDSTSPEALAEIARVAGVHFPAVVERGTIPVGWLTKRRNSSGGIGVQIGIPGQPIPVGCFAQQRVTGQVFGASLVANFSHAHLAGVCRLRKKRFPQRPFVFAGAIGPLPIQPAVADQLERIANAWLSQHPMTGPLNIDFVCDHIGSRITLLEINPRYSASMELIERAYRETLERPISMFDPPSQWEKQLWRTRNQRDCLTPLSKQIHFSRTGDIVSPDDFAGKGRFSGTGWHDIPASRTVIPAGGPIATWIGPFRRDRLRTKTLP
ncbi:ATP-grasp domain-containing protein [Rhodopirellula sp. MGV]|uniref:ATP-grasp domain-containing protein n=1 Tax=Rhodopirellula sp. MGV TaxID=2023130 RepID=UPI000B95E18B|nr:ATP-grasp domain-containing protein [Rhodopirellula sp. MGV]OYP28285.1 hypothetical protein CGZ80_26030 [Rhodopirellula sp. MGV]PNY38837.1 hypothetical protein C2E31_02775 [Rhodopirellula baltica]